MPQAPDRQEVQMLLSALLITRKEAFLYGIPLAQLDQDYKEQEGTRIPFRQLGHSCLLDFLQSLKGGLSIKQKNGMYYAFPIVTDKTKHVSSLVAGQNSKKPTRGRRRCYRPSPCYPKVEPPRYRLDSRILADIAKYVKSNPDGTHINKVLEYARDQINYDLDYYDLTRQLRDISHEIILDHDYLYPVSTRQRDQSYHSDARRTEETAKPVAVSYNASEKVSESRPAGYSDSEFDEEYDDDYDYDNNGASRDATRRDRSDDRSYRDAGKRIADAAPAIETTKKFEVKSSEIAENENVALLINERTRIRLQKLIEKHPDGIWCADLPTLYQQEYTIPLNYEELGFVSVIDYASYLPEIFHYAQLQDKGDFKLFNAKATRPDITPRQRPKVPSLAALHNIYEQYVEPTEPIPNVLSMATVASLIPDGVMGLDETVAHICVTELDRGIHEYIDVIVADVFTPSFFWIQLLQRVAKFNVFMTELHEFYETHAKKYAMPLAVMEKGLNCACIFGDKWHRGIIKSVRPDNYVTVMFYDFGTVKSYPAEQIYFLHKSFSSLPAQAIACGLYNVKPVTGTRWSWSVSCEFVNRATNVPLVATIASIDTDKNTMLVGLTNTEGDEDFHLNDWMVQSGLAVYGKMVRIRPPNYAFQRYLECKFRKSSERGKDSLSSDSENVNLERNNVSIEAGSTSDADNAAFYDILLKLHRGSQAHKKSSNIPSSQLTRERSDNIGFSNDERVNPGKFREPAFVGKSSTIGETGAKFADDKSIDAECRKPVGTDLLDRIYEIHSRRNDTGSVSDTDRNFNLRTNETRQIAEQFDAPSIIKSKDEHFPDERVIYDQDAYDKSINSLDDEIEEKVVEIKARSRGEPCVLGTEAAPLHLRDVTRERERISDFGSIRSRQGGHGLMEPIDWSLARESESVDEKPNGTSAFANVSARRSERSDADSAEINRAEENPGNIVSTGRKAKNHRPEVFFHEHKIDGNARDDRRAAENSRAVQEAEKSSSTSKLPAAKRILLDIVKKNSAKKSCEKQRVCGKSSEEFAGRINEIFAEVGKSENEETAKTIPRSADKAFSDSGEIIARKNIDDVTTREPTKNLGAVEIPSIIPRANESFTKIVDRVLLSTSVNHDSMFVPEGNIKMGNKATHLLRSIHRRMEKTGNERVKIFIPNDVLEMMRSLKNDEFSASGATNLPDKSDDLSSGVIGDDRGNERILEVSSESLAEISDTSNSLAELSKLNDLADCLKSTAQIEDDSAKANCENLKSIDKSAVPMKNISLGSTENNEIKSTVPKSIASRGEKNLIENDQNSCELKSTNASLHDIFVKPSSKQLSNLRNARLETTNDSGLDSDDLSCVEEIRRDRAILDEDSSTSSNVEIGETFSKKIDEAKAEKEFSDPDDFAESIDPSEIDDEKLRVNESKKIVNLPEKNESLDKISNELDSLAVDVFPAKDTKNVNFIPVFNDEDIMSDDDDTWDFSPGCFGNAIEAREQNFSREELTIDRIGKNVSIDESSLEISENVEIDSSPNGSSRQETDTDTQLTANKYDFVDDDRSSDKDTNPNDKSTLADRACASFDPDKLRRSFGSSDISIGNAPLVKPDEVTNSIDEISDDSNPADKKSFKRHSIMDEIKKSNIFNTSGAFASVSRDGSTSSGEKSGDSYKNSLINALKKYF